jgi:ABC-type multidrug transport system ATPase subunit
VNAPVVVCRQVVKQYGAQRALDGLNLEVPQGAIFGLLGPNGAGKSTAFGVMCGWLQATSGETEVLGTPSRELWRVAGRVSALPQDASFPPQLAIREQLAMYARAGGMTATTALQEADRTLALVKLHDAGHKRGSQLSHGMHKRAGLAQALLGRPEVIFLDEPTSGLDPVTAREIKDLIASLRSHATVIVSSHNLSEVQEICSHGAILDHGRLVAYGTIADLTRQGAEVTIHVRDLTAATIRRLCERFGNGNVQAEPSSPTLRIRFASTEDPAGINRDALRILLDTNTPVLGLSAGTSLERAFIDLTKATSAGPARSA